MGDQDFTEERTKVFETEEIIDGKNVKKKELYEQKLKMNINSTEKLWNLPEMMRFLEKTVSGQQNQINYYNKNVKSESRKC